MKPDIDQLVAGIAPAPGPGMTAGALELLEEITAGTPAAHSTEPAARSRRRRRLAVPVVAAITVGVAVAGWVLPGDLGLGPRPASALDIKREGGYYVITVKQLFADPKRYAAELRAHGIDISLRVEPVSPSLVGVVLPPFEPEYVGLSAEEIEKITHRTDRISPITPPGACAVSWICAIGLKIPVDYRGKAVIPLGRKGRPGERYRAFAQLDLPGEPLQCLAFVNRTVAQVRPLLNRHHVTIATFAVPLKGSRSWVPGSWYVQGGWLTEPGKALLEAAPSPKPSPFPSLCPKKH